MAEGPSDIEKGSWLAEVLKFRETGVYLWWGLSILETVAKLHSLRLA